MPLHDYHCEHCAVDFIDVYQKYEDEPLVKCNQCGKNTLTKLFSPPTFFVSQEATTVGQIADRNAKKMGKREVEERTLKKKDETKSALKEAKKELYSNINNMSDTQKRKFIDNG
jgi:putative FmdB family regulatory protein